MSKRKIYAISKGLAGAVAAAIAGLMGTAVQASTIAQAEIQPSGTAVALGGATDPTMVVTAIATTAGTSGDGYTYANDTFLANDGSGSLDVFGPISGYTPNLGDGLSVTGPFSPFNCIPEVGGTGANTPSVSLTSFGNTVPGTTPVTITQLNAVGTTENLGIEAYLVELDNVTFTGLSAGQAYPVHANFSYQVTDGTNNLTVFFNPSSYEVSGALGGQTIPTGPVDITGIIDAFNGVYDPNTLAVTLAPGKTGSPVPELIPFTITAVPEPASMSLLVLGGVTLLVRRRRNLAQ